MGELDTAHRVHTKEAVPSGMGVFIFTCTCGTMRVEGVPRQGKGLFVPLTFGKAQTDSASYLIWTCG